MLAAGFCLLLNKFYKIVVLLKIVLSLFVCADSAARKLLSPLDNCGRGHVQLVDIDPCVWLLLQLLLSLWHGHNFLKPGGTSPCCCSSCEREREREREIGSSSENDRKNFWSIPGTGKLCTCLTVL